MAHESRPAPSSPQVTERMRNQRRRATAPEALVGTVLRELGQSYRLNRGSLPGSPDFSNRSRGWAIFVHGCYWHHHEGCPRATVPRANREWWLEKFRQNRARDVRKARALEDVGLGVIVVWECETRDPSRLRERLADELRSCRGP
jgi:DNA mismatch endonuclease (patch repair protein)